MALKMKRFTSLLNRSKSNDGTSTYDFANAPTDSPEANAGRAIRLFCESGSNSNGGEEVLHLPVIVEAAESCPSAAAASAQQIRRFLTKEWAAKSYVQYNAIMLVRILSDNPGATFTRNFDKAFVGTVKELLRGCKDQNTQQILRETLDSLEVNKAYDEGLQGLLQMWRKEKGQVASLNSSRSVRQRVPVAESQQQQQPAATSGVPWHNRPFQQPYQPVYTNGSQQYSGSRVQSRNQLPPPFELASRVEEARNTAKILMQLIQSTPAEEVTSNDLIKEFSERCQSAQKSLHGYIGCDSPPPDDDTLQTLIETNEQLSLAGSRYQRAILAARRAMGAGGSPSPGPGLAEGVRNGNGGNMNAPLPPIPPQGESLSAPPQRPQNQNQNQYADGGLSLFAQPQPQPQLPPQQTHPNGYESYISPPSPPPPNTFQQQQHQPPPHRPQSLSPPTQNASLSRPPSSGPLTDPFNDPIADPIEHDANRAPLAIEPTNYGVGPGYTSPTNRTHVASYSGQSRSRQPSTAFSLDGVSTYSGGVGDRRHTVDLENSYATYTHQSQSQESPDLGNSRRSPSIPSTVTPVSAMTPNLSSTSNSHSLSNSPDRQFVRPGPGAWQGVTPSYMGRQASAANGVTMHGAGSEEGVAEIDSHSDVGRRDRDLQRSGGGGDAGAGSFSVRDGRAAQGGAGRRVNIARTGGWRSSVVGRS